MTKYDDQNLAPGCYEDADYSDYDAFDDPYRYDEGIHGDGGVLAEATFHGQGIYDGAYSIDEMIERLSNTIVSLLALREAGWTLASVVANDYADLILEG